MRDVLSGDSLEVKRARAFIVDCFLKEHGQSLVNLRDRWEDEKEYEDWSKYEKYMKTYIPEFVSARNEPFIVVVQFAAIPFQIMIKVTDEHIEWKSLTIPSTVFMTDRTQLSVFKGGKA